MLTSFFIRLAVCFSSAVEMDIELKDTLNGHWKNDKTGFGFKMLQKMGWSEEKGLGKNETGSVASIKAKKRAEGLGLGMDQNVDSAGDKAWGGSANGFNDVLAMLKTTYKKSKKIKKSSKTPTIEVGMK